jgi:streptogramin lyase
MTRNMLIWKRALWSVGLALVGLALVWSGTAHVSRAEVAAASTSTSPAPYASYLYLFIPGTQTFITMPLSNGALPAGVAVSGTNPTHVWVTEYGLNRITHIVFTSTASYTLAAEYLISSTANSGPFLITIDGSNVWFTEREANRVACLEAATGDIEEFDGHGLPANAGLADLNVAPDGSVWIAGQYAKRLYRLVITPTVDYAFHGYLAGRFVTSTVGPFGIDIVPGISPLSYQVAFASPLSDTVGVLTPSTPHVQIVGPSGVLQGQTPLDVAYDSMHAALWFSEPGGNALGQSFKGTLGFIPAQAGPITRPTSLSRFVGNALWLTQQDDVGQIARMTYRPPGTYDFVSYPLPQAGLKPTGIALDDDGQVWTVAYMPARLYLPAVLR